MKWNKINESYGKIKILSNGCKMRDMGDCFVVIDKHGKNIGECRTEIEAEEIAEQHGMTKESRSELSEERSDELVGNVYDFLKVYIEALVYGGDTIKNRSSLLFKKERFMDAIKSLEQECGFIK